MNPIHDRLVTGTVGELLVQLRLLQYGVQAAPPLKDSGNDLIAVRGEVFRAIQVRTSRQDDPNWKRPERPYHLVALVGLVGDGDQLLLDQSPVYLMDRHQLPVRGWPKPLDRFLLSEGRVREFFSQPGE